MNAPLRTRLTALLPLLALLALGGCASPRSQTTPRATASAKRALARFAKESTAARAALAQAYGYAIFPSVVKGALMIGGARGMGQVYQGGRLVGVASLTQASIGFQIGGESFSELVVFNTPRSFHRFTDGTFSLGASATAVVIRAGASASASYGANEYHAGAEANAPHSTAQSFAANRLGYEVYIMVRGGLLASAAIDGQHFGYHPI
jgi:lipid-binding SYLF domain-containing protein